MTSGVAPGEHVTSEALAGALPRQGLNPHHCPYQLYAEQLSGTAFTAPRAQNRRTWLYRARPCVATSTSFAPATRKFAPTEVLAHFSHDSATAIPNAMRWKPRTLEQTRTTQTFLTSLKTVCGSGSAETRSGFAIHTYAADTNMDSVALCNADGEMLVVPQEGTLYVRTEMGRLAVPPGFCCVLPRGVRFSVDLSDELWPKAACASVAAAFLPQEHEGGGSDDDNNNNNNNNNNKATTTTAAKRHKPEANGQHKTPDHNPFIRGYILESFSGHFQLPDLGVLGANALAHPRDFEVPAAAFEGARVPGEHFLIQKFLGSFHVAKLPSSPFDVAAYHGNVYPYRYDLRSFCPMVNARYDHADPSVHTALTVPNLLDFVVFAPRWLVAEQTFRPPYFHRNVSSEYMGLIYGMYEAKQSGGFQPGGASLHVCMTPHGPDAEACKAELNRETTPHDTPQRLDGALAFMFESASIPRVTPWSVDAVERDVDYESCWRDIPVSFDGPETL